jgi:hypothetical protein
MRVYGYVAHDIPKGTGFMGTMVASSELAFLRQLDQWNRIGAPMWLYHSDPNHIVRRATFTETKTLTPAS